MDTIDSMAWDWVGRRTRTPASHAIYLESAPAAMSASAPAPENPPLMASPAARNESSVEFRNNDPHVCVWAVTVPGGQK